MKLSHWFITALLVIGLLYVYHNFIQTPGGIKQSLKGLGINR